MVVGKGLCIERCILAFNVLMMDVLYN